MTQARIFWEKDCRKVYIDQFHSNLKIMPLTQRQFQCSKKRKNIKLNAKKITAYCNLNKTEFPHKFVTKKTPHPQIYRTHPPLWGSFIVQLSVNFYMSQFCNWQCYLFSKVINAAAHTARENRTDNGQKIFWDISKLILSFVS